MGKTRPVTLTSKQRRALDNVLQQPTARAGYARRVRVILLSADGVSGREIAQRVGITEANVSRIRARFEAGGVNGLPDQPNAPPQDPPATPATLQPIHPPPPSPP